MQLVARAEASRSTTEMLLDPFLNGLLHKFFLEKWRSFGRRLHYARTSLDALILFLLLHLAFGLKESPRNCNVRPVSTPAACAPPHPLRTPSGPLLFPLIAPTSQASHLLMRVAVRAASRLCWPRWRRDCGPSLPHPLCVR